MDKENQIDVVIVGGGLSGCLLALELEKRGKSWRMFTDKHQSISSEIAPGIVNPLVLKRYTLAWKAPQLLEGLKGYYDELESTLEDTFVSDVELFRLFKSQKEVDLWLEKSDNLALQPFMDEQIYEQANPSVSKVFGLGKVKSTFRVDLKRLINRFETVFEDRLITSCFDYERLELKNHQLSYQNLNAKTLIFAEGFGMKTNPFFNYLPLAGSKGEWLSIKSETLKLNKILKGGIMLRPEGKHRYQVAASFDWEDLTYSKTEKGRQWLLDRLETMINCPYTVVDHKVGIRPTVKDRRPLLGRHPKYKQMYVFNGMGTRGLMLAPYGIKMLLDNIEFGTALDNEWDIKRFETC